MTDVELSSMIAEQAPRMSKDMIRNLKKDLRNFLSLEINRDSKYFTLMGMPSKEGNSTRYVTLFNINRQNKKIDTTNEIYDFEYVTGSLEHSIKKGDAQKIILQSMGIREHVCDILEGGEDAFKKREEKYGF